MRDQGIRRALTRYRADYLRLKNAIHDRTTALPAYPALLQIVRTFLEKHRTVGVIHIRPVALDKVESLYGWQVFDGLVARAAEVVRRAIDEELPEGTRAGVDRVAGGEFILFVPHKPSGEDVDARFIEALAAALRERLEHAFDVDEFSGLNPPISFRAGHALLSINPFFRFERCVYAAVEQARSREHRREVRRVRSMSDELRRIIAESAVHVLFQPVVELESGRVVGYEALARGPKDSAFEAPSAMFSASTRAGLSGELDRVCREAALRDSARFEGGGELFVNVLPGSLDDTSWLAAQPPTSGQDYRERWRLVLEVSERALDGNGERFAGSVEAIRAAGFSLALDDVGTGYGSIAMLERMRPDYLKVDASIVRGIERNLIKREVLSSLLLIAERIGARVVAEGVETEQELAALRDVGAQLGQGYLFAGPSAVPGGSDPDTGQGH